MMHWKVLVLVFITEIIIFSVLFINHFLFAYFSRGLMLINSCLLLIQLKLGLPLLLSEKNIYLYTYNIDNVPNLQSPIKKNFLNHLNFYSSLCFSCFSIANKYLKVSMVIVTWGVFGFQNHKPVSGLPSTCSTQTAMSGWTRRNFWW